MSVQFNYTGANFTTVEGPNTTAYTNQRVTGFVILDRLPLTSEHVAPTVEAFSFFDGWNAISSSNGGTLTFNPEVNDATDTIISATANLFWRMTMAGSHSIDISAVGDSASVMFGGWANTGNAAGMWSQDKAIIGVFDTTTGQTVAATAKAVQVQGPLGPTSVSAVPVSVAAPVQTYSGPVSNVQEQYINITSDSLNVSVNTPNWFIHSGSGDDAIAVNSGTNVLDGGTGSNFLTGGSGTDTFFVDDRAAPADIWSTVNNFHVGDAATIWGVTAEDFGLNWVDGQGAAGFTGLTLHATAAGRPTASLTLAGYSQADLSNGRLSVMFGADPASGSAYMYVHGNS